MLLLGLASRGAVHQLPYTYSTCTNVTAADVEPTLQMAERSSRLSAQCATEIAAIKGALKAGRLNDICTPGRAITQVFDELPGDGLLVYSPGSLADIGKPLRDLGKAVKVVVVPST